MFYLFDEHSKYCQYYKSINRHAYRVCNYTTNVVLICRAFYILLLREASSDGYVIQFWKSIRKALFRVYLLRILASIIGKYLRSVEFFSIFLS